MCAADQRWIAAAKLPECPASGSVMALVKVMPDGSLNEMDCSVMEGAFDAGVMNRVIEVCKTQPALFAW